jgi:hypothetical protein
VSQLTLEAAARRYAAHGWPVFPLLARGKSPEGGRGYLDATTDSRQIDAWWSRQTTANIGCWPAGARFLVVDVDGPAGERAAAALGLLAEPTLQVLTGRDDGGRHLYFRHPGGVIGNCKPAPQLDVRADHGYVLLPPSVHPSGRLYKWAGKIRDVADLPARILPLLQTPIMVSPSIAAGTSAPSTGLPGVISEGGRNHVLTQLGGAMRRHGCDQPTITTALLTENTRRCRPPLPEGEVRRIAGSVMRYVPAARPPTYPTERLADEWPTAVRSARWG